MGFFNNLFDVNGVREGDDRPLTPVKRWLQAITSHYLFSLFMSWMLALALLPALFLVFLFISTGGLILLVAVVPALGLAGPIWIAIHRTVRENQFGFPCYIFKEFWARVRENLKQGYALGCLFGFLWLIVIAPVFMALALSLEVPVFVLLATAFAAVVLGAVSAYAFYQAGRYKMSLAAVIRNSFLLLLGAGPRTIVVGLIWGVAGALTILFWIIVIPAGFFLGLPVILCTTAQAVFVPKVDELLTPAAGE